MDVNIKIPVSRPLIKRLLYIIVLLLLSATLTGCILYLSMGHDQLKTWFLSLNDCFYRRAAWSSTFLTPEIKAEGNQLAIIGLVVAISGMAYAIFGLWKSKKYKPVFFNLHIKGWGWYAALAILALGYGIYGCSSIKPAYDEVFSAVNCVELHPFQTISYYMLPNNHLYFNLANNILFHFAKDHVQTGRFISMIAYVILSVSVLYWFRQIIQNPVFAFLCTIPVIIQFTTWGFGFQARCYEWQLLCGWLAFISVWQYVYTGGQKWLKLNVLFCIGGFVMVPFFIYYFITQSIFIAFLQIYNRRISLQYWKYQMIAGAGMLVFYLPAFCFSGIKAFTDNPYVRPAYKDWMTYSADFFIACKFFISFCFSMLCGENRLINFILFFLPLLLFFSKRKERRLMALFYLVLWLVFMIYTLHLLHNPFNRNLSLHYSFAMAFACYTLYAMIQWATSFIKKPLMRHIAHYTFFGIPLIIFCVHILVWSYHSLSFNLYFNDVNSLYATHTKEIETLPKNETIGFSDESFYMYYLCEQKHYTYHKCLNGNEVYYIKRYEEQLPEALKGRYELYKEWSEDYEVYKRK